MEDCIFCKIANREIDSEIVFENETVVCFEDNNPQTQDHFLIVPKEHYADLIEIAEYGADDAKDIIEAIPEIVDTIGIREKGFRVINNCGEGAGQTVFHVHFHLLADDSKLRETLV